MKISNILEQVFDTEIRHKTRKGAFGIEEPDPDEKELGRGYFSKVSKHDDPHLVKKTSLSPDKTKQDGYWSYVNFLIDYKLWENNPYFPRIYKKDKTTDARKATMKSVDMERLFPLKSLSFASLEALVKKMFGENVLISPEISHDYGKSDMDYKKNVKRILIADITRALQNYLTGSEYELGILLRVNPNEWDEKLIEALKILKTISSRNSSSIDVHQSRSGAEQENVMVRKGPYGAQLVFTDPLSI